jgi:hypothetical protein
LEHEPRYQRAILIATPKHNEFIGLTRFAYLITLTQCTDEMVQKQDKIGTGI